ncbi:MAG: 3-dehydroquinate dehydratase, partial [Flavobacteriales bacterium]|nr:3-dehydroquinate dehydratase [Flavobacteriales bacterium]
MKLCILNGPNLNLLGQREPEIYGSQGFDSFLETLRKEFSEHTIDYIQSNVEGEIINAIHRYAPTHKLIVNGGGYSHTSV